MPSDPAGRPATPEPASSPSSAGGAPLAFGDYELVPGAYRLLHRGEEVHLEPRVFEVLEYLIRHRDRVVPKKELLDELWPEDFVTESALSRTIRDLRRALGDTGAPRRFVETVYGRGFRFRGEVEGRRQREAVAASDRGLLEREDELETLSRSLELARQGGSRLLLVTGEAGIGKTSLLEHFLALAETGPASGGATRTLWGGCDALLTPRALGPLQDLAPHLDPRLAASIARSEPRDAIFARSLSALETIEKPTILVLEDLHWADEATLDWFKFLGRRLPRLRGLLVLATYRDDEVGASHALRGVLGDLPRPVTQRLRLRPLSREAVEVLADLADRPSQALWRTTGGNPFFVTEALSTDDGKIPSSIRDAVCARAARLSPRSREVLDLISVVPTRVEEWLLEDIGADSAAIAEGLESGMLRQVHGELAFRHELARLALEEELAAPRSRELHARVFEALAERLDPSAGAARLVHHATRAGRVADVLRLAPLAAEQAALLGAHREAAAHYRTALEASDGLAAAERARLYERFSYECYLTDQLDEALEARRRALGIWESLERPEKLGESLRWLSRLLWFVGRNAEATSAAERAIEMLEPFGGRELAMAYSNRAQLHMLAREHQRAIEWGHRAIELARAVDDVEVLSHALNNVGTAEYCDDLEGGRTKLEESLELALEAGLQEHVARAYTNLGSAAVSNRDYSSAGKSLDAGIDYCRERDLDSWVDYMTAWRARLYLETSRWQESAEEALRVLERTRVAAVSRIPALAALGAVRARRGDPGAEEVLLEGRKLAERTGELQRLLPVAIASAEAAWWHGDRSTVVELLEPVLDLALRHPHPWELGELLVWLWRAGAPIPSSPDLAPPFALEIAGDWQGAASGWSEIGCPYESALALCRGGLKEQRRAMAIFRSLGAKPALEALHGQGATG